MGKAEECSTGSLGKGRGVYSLTRVPLCPRHMGSPYNGPISGELPRNKNQRGGERGKERRGDGLGQSLGEGVGGWGSNAQSAKSQRPGWEVGLHCAGLPTQFNEEGGGLENQETA